MIQPMLHMPSAVAQRPDQATEDNFAHLQRRRRVRVSSTVSVVFEDQQTLWFRLEELARMARMAPSEEQQRQLAWYHRLMPGQGKLSVAIWLSARMPLDDAAGARTAEAIELHSSASHIVRGEFLPEQMTDRLMGQVRWATFEFNDEQRDALHDPYTQWQLVLELPGVPRQQVRLPEIVVESLSADIE